MSGAKQTWLAARLGRLSTGPKMLVILIVALLPLGMVAIFASVYSARENSEQRAEQTLSRLDEKTERLNELVARAASTIRAAGSAITASAPDPRTCDVVLRRLASLQDAPGRFALFGEGNRTRCASPGFAPAPRPRSPGTDQRVELNADGSALQLVLFHQDGSVEGLAEFSRAAVGDLTYLTGTPANFNLELSGGGGRMLLREDYRAMPFVTTVTKAAPIAGGPLQLRITLGSAPIRALDVLLILLPVMMWLGAGIIGWWVVNHQLLRPLAAFHKVVSSYRPGDRPLELPELRSPAIEIGELAAAFDQVTRTVARHEADLEAAVERQTRLVREVHHRVKNNLQVVASLLNLHSRGSPSEEAAAAYASIQRRVDALAVVHRNHYAELEVNRGVALRPLVSELAANLRATAPAAASGMQMRIDVAAVHVTQDVAVSVAFLVTEISEYGMLSGATEVSIIVETIEPGIARLSIQVDSLAGGGSDDPRLSERFDRIITGLARQLRSPLDNDPALGRYCVRIAIVKEAEPA